MILAVDSSALVLLINPTGNPPDDPNTEAPTTDVPERIAHFLSGLTAADTIIIPTPVLAEALVQAEEGGPGILAALGGQARMKVRPFGERAAVETAAMTREAIQAGDKKSGSLAPWQKVKVDRQVIAVARVEGATRIYADDKNLVGFAKALGMDAFSTWELPVPEQAQNLFTAAGVPMENVAEEQSAEQPDPIGPDEKRGSDTVDADDLDVSPELIDAVLSDLRADAAQPTQRAADEATDIDGPASVNNEPDTSVLPTN